MLSRPVYGKKKRRLFMLAHTIAALGGVASVGSLVWMLIDHRAHRVDSLMIIMVVGLIVGVGAEFATLLIHPPDGWEDDPTKQ